MKSKNILFSLLAVLSMVFFGCGATTGVVGHSVETQVQLSQANYKVTSSVTGQASGSSVFGIGINQTNLVDQARRDMISKAGLVGGSKAVINVTTDVQAKWFLIWFQKTVYVSGEVIEFIK